MELSTPQQAPGDVGGLEGRALGRRVCGQITRHGDQDVAALVGVAPFAELAYAGLEHLIGMEACILAQQRLRERAHQLHWRKPEREMACNQACSWVDLPLAIERLQQGSLDFIGSGGKVIEPFIAVAR